MSPEVSSGLPQSFQADFFSMGIIGYEFMFGKRPYHTSNRRAYVQDLTSKQIFISKEDYPELCEWSDESIDFINRLLIRKQDKRLGAGGIDELKNHTGNDKEVQDYVMGFPEAHQFMDKLTDMMLFLIPNYIKEGKYQLVIGIGCTGGKHRSVTLYERLKDQGNYSIKLTHRDVGL